MFRQEDRLDADRIFSVFTKEFGRLEVFGKAIRKIDSKLCAGMSLFSFCTIEFVQGKHKKTLTDALPLKKYAGLAQNSEKLEMAHAMAGVLGNFIKGQELDSGIWETIKDSFDRLQNPATNHKFLYYYFFWNFISLLGYRPELFHCVMCRQPLAPGNLYFSYYSGGVACNRCAAHEKAARKINADAIKILRLILKKEWGLLSKLKIAPASKMILKDISEGYHYYLLGQLTHEDRR